MSSSLVAENISRLTFELDSWVIGTVGIPDMLLVFRKQAPPEGVQPDGQLLVKSQYSMKVPCVGE
jgi:hypothetical protein